MLSKSKLSLTTSIGNLNWSKKLTKKLETIKIKRNWKYALNNFVCYFFCLIDEDCEYIFWNLNGENNCSSLLFDKLEEGGHKIVPLRCHRAALGVLIHSLSELENYTISHKLGRGKYAHVFEGSNIKTKQKVAIKVLLPIKPSKIKR